ncbi:MAG: 4'-phosphopantetheinyl transferase superfamily protein [Xanthomonadales bacterium]|nr:4'-phosphopantetheinyl transferase superfamily protein [Xanthomonadales bacterium]
MAEPVDHNTVVAGRFRDRRMPLGGLEIPAPGIVHLWFLDLAQLATPLGEPAPGTVLKPRQSRSTRRFYLRLLLGAYLGLPGKDVRISRIIKGKPVLDASAHPQQLDFSSAGSGQSCLIGISSEGLLGVDLECADRETLKPRALARRYFSASEQHALAALDDAELHRAFIHTWACKEAVVKAAGLGIANQLCRFSVSVDPDQPARLLDMDDDVAANWSLAMLQPTPDYLAAVALRQPLLQLDTFRLLPPAMTQPSR